MGEGQSKFNNNESISESEIVADEIPSIITAIDNNLQEFKESRKRYLELGGTPDDGAIFKNQEFEIVLKGNADKTKVFLEKRYSNLLIISGKRYVDSFPGFIDDTPTPIFKDSLKIKIFN
jgi:hypothetical protein